MAMNENEKNETAVSAGTQKNSGRYPWPRDEGLTEIEAMGNALLELEDELNSVVEDLHRWFGRYGIEDLGTMRSDLDHINEVLRPRIECQHSEIYSQYNKKLKQIDELANAYASLIESHGELETDNSELKKQIAESKEQIDKLLDKIRGRDKALERADKLLVENSKLYASESNLKRDLRAKISANEQLSEQLDDCEERICELEAKATYQGKLYSQLLDQNKYLKAEVADKAFQVKQLREENERLTAKVKEAEDNNLKLVTKKYELETRLQKLESEFYDAVDSYDDGFSAGYDEGFDHGHDDGLGTMYEGLLTLMDIIHRDDFERVFHLPDDADPEDILDMFSKMSPREFLESCQQYHMLVKDEIKVGDELHCYTGSGWCMIVTEIKDNWYKGIITLGQSPVNIRKNSGDYVKTGRHFAYIPLDYDGEAARNKIRKA